MSPPSPCSPSNLSLKTSFLPFIIFFFAPHLQQHHAAWQWPARRVMWSPQWLLPGRRKGKCVSEDPLFGPAGRSGVNSTLIQSVRATKGPTHFYSGLPISMPLLTLSFLSSLLFGLQSDPKVSLQSLRLTTIKYMQMWSVNLNITRISGASPQQGQDINCLRRSCPFTIVNHVKKSESVMPCKCEICKGWSCWALRHSDNTGFYYPCDF